MASEQLSLSWNDHSDSLVTVFQNLLSNNSLVDCTLAAEGQYLKAHKVVLSACSPYFQLLFMQESEKNPIIILKDVKFQELKAVIDFVYRGEVKISENELGAFLEVATSLRIKGLSKDTKANAEGTIEPDLPASLMKQCFQEGKSNISENACQDLQMADTIDSQRNNEFPLQHELCNSSGPNHSTAQYSMAPSFCVNSDKHLVASTSHDSLKNSETTQSFLPQSAFHAVERLLPDDTSVIKTEADVFEERETTYGTESTDSFRENDVLDGGKDVIMEETAESAHVQSASNHDYSHFPSLLENSELRETTNPLLAPQHFGLHSSQGIFVRHEGKLPCATSAGGF